MLYASRFLRIMNPFMEGIDVSNIQERLSELGFFDRPVTGVYDRETAETVRNYQVTTGLTADGIVGPETYNAIGISARFLELFDSQYTITVSIEQLQLVLKERGTTLNQYPVAVGKPSTPTPTGNWRIIQKTLNPGGPFGARWMRLNIEWGGYGIHGTDEPESIGFPVSRGCIRMINEDVIELYNIAPLGTAVNIIGVTSTGRLLAVGVQPGPDISRVQEILQTIGYYTGPINGVYTEQVRDAVIRFQQDYGITADGIVGPQTYATLEKANDIILKIREP